MRLRNVMQIVNTPGAQPRGGFLPADKLSTERVATNEEVKTIEECYQKCNIPPQTMGTMVDHLSRTIYAMNTGGCTIEGAVKAGFKPAFKQMVYHDEPGVTEKRIRDLAKHLSAQDKDYKAIATICVRFVDFVNCARSGILYKTNIKANEYDAKILEYLLDNAAKAMAGLSKIQYLGYDFSPLETEGIVGEIDLLTKDSIIDIKCTAKEPDAKQTFQLLVYYVAGMHASPATFEQVRYLKIINPRKGIVYTHELNDADITALSKIEELIGCKTFMLW